jgi:hypothetical protein
MSVCCPTPSGFGVAPMYAWVALWCVGREFVKGNVIGSAKAIMRRVVKNNLILFLIFLFSFYIIIYFLK